MVTISVLGRNMDITCAPLVLDRVRDTLSIPDPQAYFRKQRSEWLARNWDGRIHHYTFFTDGSLRSPVGLLPKLEAALREWDLPYEVDTPSPFVPIPYDHLVCGRNGDGTAFHLDPLQEEVCRITLARQVCSIELETSSGKTEIFANAIACFNRDHPDDLVLVIVPKVALLRQTYQRLCQRLPHLTDRIGMLGDGERGLDKVIIVATPDTASAPARIMDRDEIVARVKQTRLLILDEAHRSQSSKWNRVIEAVTREDALIWAFSGKVTFFAAGEKHKQMALEATFGPPAYSGGNKARHSPVRVISYTDTDWAGRLDHLPLTGGVTHGTHVKWRRDLDDDWKPGIWRGPDIDNKVPDDMIDKKGRKMKEKYGVYDYRGGLVGEQVKDLERSDIVYLTVHDIALMEFAPRNDWAVALARGFYLKAETFLVTVQRRRHATKLIARMEQAGIPVVEITGSMTGTQQEKALTALNGGKYAGAVAVYSIVSEGVDIPKLVHLVKLDGLAGEQVLEQQKGRVQRAAQGKEAGFLHVPVDSQHKAALATTRRMLTYFKRRDIAVEKVVQRST